MDNTKAACVRGKKRMKDQSKSNPWFDTECRMKKENLNHKEMK